MVFKQFLATLLATSAVLVSVAQQRTNYQAAYKKIDSLINNNGLTRSALTEVNKLYALAKKEKNDVQLIKALVYRISLEQEITEQGVTGSIAQLEKEITQAAEPARSILQNITAQAYWNYLQNNRYRLYSRTETINFKKEDIATWGISDLHKKISDLFLASLSHEKLLKQTKLEPYDPLIVKGNVRYLRPTLFDLLAHRALLYFRNNERNLQQPAYAFEINDQAAFADAATFAAHRFTTRDSVSVQFKALQLFQRLLQFHANDAKKDALVDVDINRVQYVYESAVMEEKDSLYKKALERITVQYGDMPAASYAWYLLANWYAQKAYLYNPVTNDTFRYARVTAREICEKVVAQKEASEGKTYCRNLLNEILGKNIQLSTENVNLPGVPFRTLVTWRNFTSLYVRVIKIDKKTRESLGNDTWENEYWKKLVALPVVKTITQTLPDTKDHQRHSAEIKIDGLPLGEYAIMASPNKDFSFASDPLVVQYIGVSNISYVRKDHEYFVVHRERGQPLTGARVQVWHRQYNNAARKYEEQKGDNLIAGKDGYVKVIPSGKKGENNYRLEITMGDDRLNQDNYTYYYTQPNREERAYKSTFLFTDRSIYRPGQILYFKGIVVSRGPEHNKSNILPDFASKLFVMDVNGQKIDSLSLTTNAFGSYAGKFTLPTNLLNGQFQLHDPVTSSSVQFSVEEYKRPTFEVAIAQPKGLYRLNDSIQVTGTAKGYAGNNLNGAKVKYRVVRQTIMPMWDYGFRYSKMIWPPRPSQQVEIAHGEALTDAKGEFTVRFKAIPDKTIAQQDQVSFHYTISADVTDVAGETRSASTSVAAGYRALQLTVAVQDKIHTDSLRTITVSSTNLNQVFEKSLVTVSIYPLKTPERIFRERYWPQPDQFLMSQEEYYRLFPYDIYKDETEITKWPRLSKVAEKTDSTTATGRFTVEHKPLTPGLYVIEATTKDKYGQEVKAIKYVELYNQSTSTPIAFGDLMANKITAEPGDTIRYRLSTNLDSAYVVHEMIRANDSVTRRFQPLNKNSRLFEIPVAEKDRGGFGVNMFFVKNNRLYTSGETFNIPFTNKDLNIAFQTYRDKTLPGSEEKWSVKISGHKNEKVAAEYLAAMYDASLDQFKPHSWQKPALWTSFVNRTNWVGDQNFAIATFQEKTVEMPVGESYDKIYDHLAVGEEIGASTRPRHMKLPKGVAQDQVYSAAPAYRSVPQQGELLAVAERSRKNSELELSNGWAGGIGADTVLPNQDPSSAAVQVRKNLNETAFFFPDLKTDSAGNISFSFTMPEAVTQWKWMSLAHTQDLSFGYDEKTIVTQKELMVQPNAPRFMREGDRMDFSGKITNLTEKEITGQVQLQLIDATNNQPVDGWFRNMFPSQYFTVAAGQSTPVTFTLEIPYQYNRPVTYRLIAQSGSLSDGEENILPVISNRMLVTESLPLPMRGATTKNFKFEKLLQSGNSETLNHHALTVEFTSNPAWYAIQAMPYLMEYPYDCAEQVFNRYYANALAGTIANASPRIKAVFERWKTADTAALLSNLQKNKELKSVLLQETPWVLQAKSEAQQKKNIAWLFDMVRMSKELSANLGKLKDLQSDNGGFVWFKGGPDDRYMTQYILTGIGHLKKLKALPADDQLTAIVKAGIVYLDNRIRDDYDNLLKRNKNILPAAGELNNTQIQYLYMRSFFPETGVPGTVLKAYSYYRKQAQQKWLKQGKYLQGMIALSLQRTGDQQLAKNIVASLKQNAIVNEEMGMYWKDIVSGYYWHQAPIESQSLLIEAFTEITHDSKAVEDMKTWLLKQKQTQHWKSTKATADACYALLLQGTQWLDNTPTVTIQLGDYKINSNDQAQEAGTGYFKKVIDGPKVQPGMGDVKANVSGASTGQPAWGAVYWQYFENLDKITPATTPLQLSKKLFVEKNTDRGPVLHPVNEGDALQVGDKIKVRIELRTDRTMEYVHMKDMRAACMEPVNVLSAYKWQGGLGYYETTKDASTNFFFGSLPKGTYVFEYALFVTHTGTFSNGITSIQCMYAPEFASHSEGIKVNVE